MICQYFFKVIAGLCVYKLGIKNFGYFAEWAFIFLNFVVQYK